MDDYSDYEDDGPRDSWSSLRSRIAALEAVIREAHAVGDRDEWPHDLLVRVLETLELAPSVVLDGMIREAKAEAEKAADERAQEAIDIAVREATKLLAERDALRAQLDGMTTEFATWTARGEDGLEYTSENAWGESGKAYRRTPKRILPAGPWVEVPDGWVHV